MEKDYVSKIANIIMSQLNVKKTEVWAWGSKNFKCLEREVNGIKCPALMFSIRTPKIKVGGRVIISYNEGADTYIIEAITMKKGIETLVGKKDDVYCDELHSVINSLIEDKETYTKIFF